MEGIVTRPISPVHLESCAGQHWASCFRMGKKETAVSPDHLGPTMAARIARRSAWCLLAVVAGGTAFAETTGSNPGTALDRLVFTLGVLILLSQATERLMVVLRTVLSSFNVSWAGPPSACDRQDLDKTAARATLLSAYSVALGLLVAFVTRTDIIQTVNTGQLVMLTTWFRGWTVQQWLGVVTTGLIASMGSAFLNDLLGMVQTSKEIKQTDKAKLVAELSEQPESQLCAD